MLTNSSYDKIGHKRLMFDFSVYISARLCCDWLSIHDVCLLDTASCHTSYRLSFLRILSYDGTVLKESNSINKITPSYVLNT